MTRKPYPTDLPPEQVEIVTPLLPTYTTGRPRTWSCIEILNAIFYVVRSGAAWRLLPHDFSAMADRILSFSRLEAERFLATAQRPARGEDTSPRRPKSVADRGDH